MTDARGSFGVVFDGSGAVASASVDGTEHRVTGFVGGSKLNDLGDEGPGLRTVEEECGFGGSFDCCD